MTTASERTPVDAYTETAELGPRSNEGTSLRSEEASSRFHPGALVGHYEIIRALGAGGMGEVHLGRDTRLGRLCALKFLLRMSPRAGACFVTEARTTALLNHENIVALYDIAEHQGQPYMVLEHIKGRTLAEWLSTRAEADPRGRPRPLPPARAAELMLPVARALACAHEAGVVHLDLKPQNVMLTDSGAVKVLDFGIAKLLGDAGVEGIPRDMAYPERGAASQTDPGTVQGTLAYMSPEQWGIDTVDERADLWAVGIMLYEMAVGEHPLSPLSPESLTSTWRLDQPMPSVRQRLPEIGRLGSVIDRCLIKRKADRLGSARELTAELSAIARLHAVAARREDGEAANPYTGLSAFQECDAMRFFGRERAVEQVVGRLAEQPFLAIVGASGAGKSSLIRAGVIPALKRGGEAWEAFIVRPGPHPLAALAALLSQHGEGLSPADADALGGRLRREPGLLGVALRARAQRRLEQVLLFVDQFEEVYTLAAEDERGAFLTCLSGAADDISAPLRVIVSLRQDFLDRIAGTHTGLAELVSRGTILLGPMDRAGLKSALALPAREAGHRFEPEGLVDEMVDVLEHTRGALPLLQFAAARLWQGRDREKQTLTEVSYRAFGGVGGALASHADSVLGAMSHTERQRARALLLRLVTPERTRAIISRSELSEIGGAAALEVERVLGKLIDARLLAVEGTGGDDGTVELVHESLIEKWPLLARWLEEEQGEAQLRSRLRNTAKEWEAGGRAEGLLWRGEAAEEAQRWLRRHDEDAGALVGAREREYLGAVMALAERARRRRRRIVMAVIASLAAFALSVTFLAYSASRAASRANEEAARAERHAAQARAQREEAERSAARARNAGRMAAARERQGDPTIALALVREIEPGATPPGWATLARWALDAGAARAVLPHQAQISSVAFSPDSRRVVSASGDDTVQVWSADGAGPSLVLRGHDGEAVSAAWSPDGRRIASASSDKTVRVWSADGSGAPLVLRGHDNQVHAVAWSPDGLRIASASWDKTVRVWSADGTGQALVLRGHDDRVLSVGWSPDGQRLVSASGDKTVRVWNAEGAGEPLILRGHGDQVYAAAWSPDHRRIVSVSGDKTVRVWKAEGGGQPLILRGHGDQVYSVAWSPDGRRIVSASWDKTVRVWSADGAAEPLVLNGHDHWVFSVAWSPNGRWIASGSLDKTVRVWSADGSDQALILRGHDAQVYDAAVSPDGGRIATASFDRTVRVWSERAKEPLVLRGHEEKVWSVAWSPDGLRLASASEDKTVRVWSAGGTGKPLTLRGHDNAVFAVAWSADGRRLASASEDKTVRVWSADATGNPIVLHGHSDRVLSVAWSPDGRRIASASYDKTVRLWSADGAAELLVLRLDAPVFSAAWSPDGRRLVSGSLDKLVRVWSADGTGDPIVLRGHEAAVVGVAFSADGARILSSSADGTVRIWKVEGAGDPLVLRGASGFAFNSARWSPDDKRVVAASDDKTTWVWSNLEPLRGPDDPRLWAATTYCPPIDVRRRILDLPDELTAADLERCQRRVREAQAPR
jgi:WD40 repeat protein